MAWWDLDNVREEQRSTRPAPNLTGERRQGNGRGVLGGRTAPRQGYTRDSYYAEVRPELRNGTMTQRPATPGVAGLPGAPTSTSSDAEIVAFLTANYPYMAAFLHNPEVRNVLINGARLGYDESRLKGALTGTRWWQSTDAANRTWQQLLAEDPAEARRLVGQTAAAIQNSARTLGTGMDAGTIASIAATATANGWTDAQTIDHLVNAFSWESTPGGDMTAYRDTVKEIGAGYLVAVSEQTARQYAAQIASGEMTTAGVESIMQRQARARFSWMGDLIDQGVRPSDYFAPIRDTIANELEVTSDEINMMDPKWLSMIEVRDEKTGQPRGATMQEAMLAARKRPEWAGTKKAQENTQQLSSMIGQIFGRAGI